MFVNTIGGFSQTSVSDGQIRAVFYGSGGGLGGSAGAERALLEGLLGPPVGFAGWSGFRGSSGFIEQVGFGIVFNVFFDFV
jgi:hypothetical protein